MYDIDRIWPLAALLVIALTLVWYGSQGRKKDDNEEE